MKVYEGANVRNVVLVGHGDAGKTSLVSGMLYTAGATQRLGRVDDGSTVTDFDEEEVARSMSISTSLAYAEWGKTKVNFLDTPGFTLFAHEAKLAMVAAESALVVVDGVSGVEVVTDKVWNYCEEFQLPRAMVVSRMDRERADFSRVMESLTSAFGRTVIPVELPIGSEKNLSGVVDLVKMKAYAYDLGGNGKGKEGEIPANLADAAKEAHEKLVELIAEGNDALMEEFFDKGTLAEDHLVSGLRDAVRERRIYPVLFASGLGNVGTDRVLDFIADYLPAATDRAPVEGAPTSGNGEPPRRKVADSAPLSLYVFKTVSDPFAGRISFFKVFSGVLKNEATVQNFTRSSSEKLAHISVMQGKNQVPVPELHAGDIGAVAKLKDTYTGDTLGDKTASIFYRTARIPEPSITFAVEPKTRADEDKIGQSIHKLMEEDLALRFARDPQTKEFLLSGAGQKHIEVVVSKLHNRYHVDLTLKPPKVPYRETIRGKADAEGKHKKQTGGRGQFGVARIRMEPLARGTGVEFVDDIFGGAIPRNFIPAVEKGLRDAAERGFLAGYPVTDFRAVLYDGKYHDVDSSELAFKLAGSKAFRECMKTARPSLLEPIMNIEVYAPEQFLGDIVGDLSGRRGRVSGNETRGTTVIVKGQAPLAELLSYANTLTSMTQGRASYTMEFSHYDYVPGELAQKIIEQAKKERGAPAEEEEE